MRDFQSYTRNTRSGLRRWLVVVAAVLIAALVFVVLRVGGLSLSGEALGFENGDGGGVDPVPAASREPEGGTSASDSGGPMNVLILGEDKRPGDEVEGTGTRSDTMIIAHIEPATGNISLVSVPRDLYVEVEPGEKDKINAAYSYNGVEGAIEAVQNYADVPIDHYAVINFNAFKSVVNEMDGLEVDVSPEVRDQFPPAMGIEEGLQTLDGRQALLYARYRGTAGGDLDRIRRQQEVIAALRSKALRWQSVTKLPEFARIVGGKVRTDMGVEQGISLGRVLLARGRGATMTATQLKGTPETLDDGTQVLIPDAAENDRILDEFRY